MDNIPVTNSAPSCGLCVACGMDCGAAAVRLRHGASTALVAPASIHVVFPAATDHHDTVGSIALQATRPKVCALPFSMPAGLVGASLTRGVPASPARISLGRGRVYLAARMQSGMRLALCDRIVNRWGRAS